MSLGLQERVRRETRSPSSSNLYFTPRRRQKSLGRTTAITLTILTGVFYSGTYVATALLYLGIEKSPIKGGQIEALETANDKIREPLSAANLTEKLAAYDYLKSRGYGPNSQ